LSAILLFFVLVKEFVVLLLPSDYCAMREKKAKFADQVTFLPAACIIDRGKVTKEISTLHSSFDIYIYVFK